MRFFWGGGKCRIVIQFLKRKFLSKGVETEKKTFIVGGLGTGVT